MYIMFDTNYFVSDFRLNSSEFKKLIENTEKLGIAIILCPYVLDEAVQKYKEFLCDYNAKTKYYQSVIPEYCNFLSEEKIGSMVESYKQYISSRAWEKVRSNVKYALPNLSNMQIHELFVRDMHKMKSFAGKGKGLRDMVIWESMKEAIRAYLNQGQVFVFISNNDSDFCEDSKNTRPWKSLHADLLRELQLMEEITLEEDSVRVYSSLKAFNNDLLQDKIFIFEKIMNELNTCRRDELINFIFSTLNNQEILFGKNIISTNLTFKNIKNITELRVSKNWTDTFELLKINFNCECNFISRDSNESIKTYSSEMELFFNIKTNEFYSIDLGNFY